MRIDRNGMEGNGRKFIFIQSVYMKLIIYAKAYNYVLKIYFICFYIYFCIFTKFYI